MEMEVGWADDRYRVDVEKELNSEGLQKDTTVDVMPRGCSVGDGWTGLSETALKFLRDKGLVRAILVFNSSLSARLLAPKVR